MDPVDEEPRTPIEHAVEQAVEHAMDAFVHAPIGLIFDGPGRYTELVQKGRNQVTTARMIGQFAVQQGTQEAAKAVAKVQGQVEGILGLLGRGSAPSAPASPTHTTPPAPAPATSGGGPTTDGADPAGPEVEVTELAIPDYDGLSASQVVNRLAGLSAEELEAVRRYEASSRGRKTILNKVAQLQKA